MNYKNYSRRDFVKSASILACASAMPLPVIGGALPSFSSKPRLAFIGTGGRGAKNIRNFEGLAEFSAFVDVYPQSRTVIQIRAEYPKVPFFKDYRKMLDKMHREIDAVVISTPDHSHFSAALWAIKAGKHVYVEKPLTHTIEEARLLKAAAEEAGVISQMGNQSFSNDGIRVCKEWIDDGLIGKVTEVIQWTDRLTPGQIPVAGKGYPQGEAIPDGLDWKLWLNVIENTPYHSNLHGNWRGWWRFGSGALGDIACHMMGIPFYALELGIPDNITASMRGGDELRCPFQSKVVYEFGTSSTANPLKLSWYDGFRRKDGKQKLYDGFDEGFLPHFPKMFPDKDPNALTDNGQFIVGEEGLIYIPAMHLGKQPVLLPEEKWEDVKNNLPEPSLERVGNHWLNFIECIQGKRTNTSSNFNVAADLTEIVLLGNLALRTGDPIKWDKEKMLCTGNLAASALVSEVPAHPEFLTK